MSRHFLELAVRARRFVSLPPRPGGARAATHRQVGTELTQFSFRLAFMIDLAYVSLGALGGAAIGQAAWPPNETPPAACAAAPRSDAGYGWPGTSPTPLIRHLDEESVHLPLEIGQLRRLEISSRVSIPEERHRSRCRLVRHEPVCP